MDNEQILETLKIVVAYQLLSLSSEGGEERAWPPSMARSIKRMIDEPDTRAVVMDVWSQVFERNNGEMYDALKEMLGGTPVWDELTRSQSASPTGDTQLTSKS